MKTFFAILMLAAPALGQNAMHSSTPACETMPPYTVGKCWDCYNDLVRNCDTQHSNSEARRACYVAANSFFTWCLDRVAPPSGPKPRNNAREVGYEAGNGYWVLGHNLTRVFTIRPGLTPDNIKVQIRPQAGLVHDIAVGGAFDPVTGRYEMSISSDHVAVGSMFTGLVYRVVEGGAVSWVNAEIVDVYTLADYNRDQEINPTDLSAATNDLASGTLSLEGFIEFVGAYKAH